MSSRTCFMSTHLLSNEDAEMRWHLRSTCQVTEEYCEHFSLVRKVRWSTLCKRNILAHAVIFIDDDSLHDVPSHILSSLDAEITWHVLNVFRYQRQG